MTDGPPLLTTSLWLGCWLRGSAAPDDVLSALAGAAPEAAPSGLLGEIRAVRPDRVWLLLPRPGRALAWPRGLPGAPTPAVLLTGAEGAGHLVRPRAGRWLVEPAGHPDLLPLLASALPERRARRAFEESIVAAAGTFERLGLERAPTARARTRWTAALHPAPPGLPAAGLQVLHRAATVLDALDMAAADDGAAVTSAEAAGRAAAVRELAGTLEDLVTDVVGGLNPSPVA